MTYLQVGSITVPAIWISTIAAFFIASILNRVFSGKRTSDWFWNSLFLYFLVWKLSYIVLNFEMFLEMPLSIVYFNGGKTGHIMALLILALYIIMLAPKKFPSIYQEASRLFLLFFICYEVVNNFLVQNHIEAIAHLILLGGFLLLLQSLRKNGKLLLSQLFILFMLLEILIISIFQSVVSWEPLTFIWLGLIVWFLSIRAGKEESVLE